MDRADRPCARGWTLSSFRRAASELWGDEGMTTIARGLPPELAPTTEPKYGPIPEWVPEDWLIAWCFSIWENVVHRDRPSYVTFLQKQTDHGFGMLRRALVKLARPKLILDRAPSIWKQDHTHGTLDVEHTGSNSANLRLSHHPYTETPQARATIAEVFRYSVSLARAPAANETHALESPGVVLVRLGW